jgi:hypothetical protein
MENKVEAKIDKLTGKLVLSGTVSEERDFEEILEQMPKFKQQITDLTEQLENQKKQLEAIEVVETTEEITKFIELSKKVQLINKRSQLEADTENKSTQLAKMQKDYNKQLDLAKEYKEWSDKQ